MEKTGLNIMHERDLEEHLVSRFDTHYILAGNPTHTPFIDMVRDLELTFFEPGTPKNKDFDLIVGVPYSYVLIPKTKENENKILYMAEKYRFNDLVSKLTKKFRKTNSFSIPPSLRYKIMKRDNYKCQICGRTKEEGTVLEIDHIKPKSKGGSDEEENLQTLCWECNRGKSDD